MFLRVRVCEFLIFLKQKPDASERRELLVHPGVMLLLSADRQTAMSESKRVMESCRNSLSVKAMQGAGWRRLVR